MLTPDTLSRWEARREGPPCMRIGRKVFYRRSSVEQWLLNREQSRAPRQRRARR
jgi:predicted DNA-binding transcriptional regulator AlpA